MPDYRRPPFEKAGRPESVSLPEDSFAFSIETTTMRLKSLKLRRAEAADRELDQRLQEQSGKPRGPPVESSPGGRVRHDERGQAVWDMAVASGEFAALSATNVMRKLDVADLKIEETQRAQQMKLEAGVRDACGGGDPYNQRSAASTDPFRRRPISGGGGDPYNRHSSAPSGSSSMKRPPPATPVKNPQQFNDMLQ